MFERGARFGRVLFYYHFHYLHSIWRFQISINYTLDPWESRSSVHAMLICFSLYLLGTAQSLCGLLRCIEA